jgi:hypothetical protein
MKSYAMITTFSILGLGAVLSRVIHIAKNHNGRFPHSWGKEFTEFFTTLAINTGFFILIMIVVAMVS